MKMIYQGRNRRERRKTFMVVSLLVVCALAIYLANRFFPHALTPIVEQASPSLSRSRNAIADNATGFWGILHSKRDLVLENTALREQLALFTATKAERDELEKENESLQALLGRKDPAHKSIVANIMSKPGYSPYDTFTIDVGKADGVEPNDLVSADELTLLGYISNVTAHTATVVLYSTSDEKNNVLVGTKALETTAQGDGGGVFTIRLPKGSGIAVGDTISLAKYPTRVLGSVTQVEDAPTNSFDQILFRSPVDINELKHLLVELSTSS